MSNKIFAGNSFFTAAGKVDTACQDPLSIVFIGGSLTSGDVDYEGTSVESWIKWPSTVTRFLAGLFPLRKISAFNAGLGGTGSSYGAMRFARDVISRNPDIIFIEFSVNDRLYKLDVTYESILWRQQYLESMIRQCMELDKVPTIVYLHTPLPIFPQTEEYFAFRMMNEVREHLFDYYGIGVIDIMQANIDEFEARRALDPTLTLDKFYEPYYHKNDNGIYDVHPTYGYQLYNIAIVNELMNHPEKYLRPFKMREEIFCKGAEEFVNERYTYTPVTSPRITHHGEWKLYTAENPFETEDNTISIPKGQYSTLSCADGIMQTEGKNGEFFELETDAKKICFPHISARRGIDCTVYINGEEASVKPCVCRSIYHGMNYTGRWIELPEGTNRIKVVLDAPDEEHIIFRYGYIIECR